MTKRYFPEKFNVVTSADETAMLHDINRIPGESLFDYKKRILESSTKMSNSSYSGLVNAINRELGLTQREVIRIEFKKIIEGSLDDTLISHNEFIISDNRYYEGIIDGTLSRIAGNKLRSHTHLWVDDYLAGMTVSINNNSYKILDNTYNELTLDREPDSLYLNETFIIRSEWQQNAFIGYALTLENTKYLIIANTSNTLTLNRPIKYRIDPKFSVILNSPRIKITASRIIFYKEYVNESNYQLDLIVDLRENSLTHRSLCKLVNKESAFFNLVDLIPFDSELKGFTFKEKDSNIKVFGEDIPLSKFFKLQNKNVKPGSIKFSESGIFGREEEELDSSLFGPYYSVNYLEGIVQTNMLPSGSGQLSYTYMNFPFIVEHAPASVIGLADKESEQFLFSQKEKIIYDDPRERFVSSQPKAEMIEYIAELLRINKQSWGT